MKNLFYIYAFIFIPFLTIYPQNQEWIYYKPSNSGLPDETIYSIALDKSGNKWIGTDKGGLAEFDGTKWTVYDTTNSGLPDNDVHVVAIDINDNKWIGTDKGGLAKFDGTNWTIYDTSNSGLPDNDVWAVMIDNSGNKWIGTHSGGLAEFDGTNWAVFNKSNSDLPFNDVRSIISDSLGNKWIGTLGGGLAEFDGTNWAIFNSYNSGLPYNQVMSVSIDENGNKWIGTFAGLAEFDGTNWIVYKTFNSDLPNDNVWPIAIDENGNKWIGTYGGGFAEFNGTNWTVYDTSNSGLPDNSILSLVIDKNGNKWIGTLYGGLAVYKDSETLPVELTSFSALAVNQNVVLNWETATEINNYGFEVERSIFKDQSAESFSNWDKVGFVKGHGNSTSIIKYTFIDKSVSAGKTYSYQLKQIDYGNKFKLSNTINVEIVTPLKSNLEQNYPNPFNPSTTIKYSIPASLNPSEGGTLVQLKVYDILSREVAVLVNEKQKPGNYEVKWNADNLPSGVYFYQIKAGSFVQTKKMILLR